MLSNDIRMHFHFVLVLSEASGLSSLYVSLQCIVVGEIHILFSSFLFMEYLQISTVSLIKSVICKGRSSVTKVFHYLLYHN